MSVDPGAVVPPDDTGAKTFSRFCYQAHVAFSFCLECAVGGAILSVVPEHIEDLAVQYAELWRFIQIKTREPHLGAWRLRDLTGPEGGLHSLLRSYRALRDARTSHELFLEGPIDPRDAVHLLARPGNREDSDLYHHIRAALALDPDECRDFLRRVRVIPNVPPRGGIVARNLRRLGTQAPDLTFQALTDVYEKLIGRIEAAMAVDLTDTWYTMVLDPTGLSAETQTAFASKQLTPQILGPLVAPIAAPRHPLLRIIVEPGGEPLSVHEEKLIEGGAPEEIRKTARGLRARATLHEFDFIGASLYPDASDRLEDVRERIRIVAEGLIARHLGAAQPAIEIWDDLMRRLQETRDSIDPNGVFQQDPFLLLGEACQLADLCLIHWGRARA